ncbi:MAG: 30S ribosomal protein S15 [Candidatus Woesearchaeota archaeon]
MAKMHSRARGNAGSKKPLKASVPTWARYKPKEIDLLIGKLAKEGKTASEIGTILRDSYGVPSVKLLTGKRLYTILAEKKQAPKLPEDLMALMKNSVLIRKHIENNPQDMTAVRGLQLAESKIKRLSKYYKETGKLEPDWKYDPSAVKIYTE